MSCGTVIESTSSWILSKSSVLMTQPLWPTTQLICSRLWVTTLTSYFEQFPMQQLSMLLQIPSRSDCPYESLFKIGLNWNTRQSSSATKDSHYYIMLVIDSIFWLGTMARDCPPQFFEVWYYMSHWRVAHSAADSDQCICYPRSYS